MVFLAFYYIYDSKAENKYQEAVSLCYRILGKNSKHPDALYLLGVLHLYGQYFPQNFEHAFFYLK